MADSSLVTREAWAHSSNYTSGRGGCDIKGIVIHHAVATNLDSVAAVFSRQGRNGSAHYGVNHGSVDQYVREDDIAWHCSNWWGNQHTIGIETCNSTLAPNYEIADDTMETLVKLVADIAKRHNLGRLYYNPSEDCSTITGHKDWQGAKTACPGPYLYPRLQEICDRANAILDGGTPAPAPQPAPAPAPAPAKSNEDLATEVIRGDWGNGADRKARLEAAGYDYGAIQAIVNARYGAPAPAPAPASLGVGSRVVPIKFVDYNGTPLRNMGRVYVISQLNGDRAVLTYNGAVYAAMRLSNLRAA